MNLLLFADKEVGSEVVDFLADAYRDDIACVVTTADNGIAEKARVAGVSTTIYKDGDSFIELIKKTAPPGGYDLGVLAWWPKLISEQIITLARQGFINFHPSLLPYNRGKHYNFWALVEQCPFGVSLHFVDRGIDSGDIVVQRAIPYDWLDTGETLFHRARREIVSMFKDEYPKIRLGQIERVPQQLDHGSFHVAADLEAASLIDLDAKYRARDLLNLLRARTFTGHPACYFYEADEKYEVRVEIRKVK